MAGSRFSIQATFTAIDRMTAPVRRMQMSTSALARGMQTDFIRAQRRAEALSGTMGATMWRGAAVGAMALGAGLVYSIRKASEMENAVASFTTMLRGNGAAAQQLVHDLQVMGAATPFEFSDLQQATVMLMGFGAVTRETAIPTLNMLGDLAQGSADRLSGISLAYGQIRAAGRASMQDVNQLINNQVPILQALAEQWGVNVGQARAMVSQGRATGEEVERAMRRMTSAGGMFYQGMLRASTTMSGLWSTFMDAIGMTAAGIGEALLPQAKSLTISATEVASKILAWVQNNKDLIGTILTIAGEVIKFMPVILGMIGAYWLYQKALLAVAFAQMMMGRAAGLSPMGRLIIIIGAIIGLVIYLKSNWESYSQTTKDWIIVIASIVGVVIAIIAAMKAWAAIQVVLNILMMANPIGLIILAIVIIIGLVVLLIKILGRNFRRIRACRLCRLGGDENRRTGYHALPARTNQSCVRWNHLARRTRRASDWLRYARKCRRVNARIPDEHERAVPVRAERDRGQHAGRRDQPGSRRTEKARNGGEMRVVIDNQSGGQVRQGGQVIRNGTSQTFSSPVWG
jgi:tape measure domain-containing protein